MNKPSIPRRRLHSQRITETTFSQPEQVVQWLGAVQAQDYAAAKWAIGLRAHGLTDAALDRALADGTILRTHVMRPTWHFVSPRDIRWLLMLTAPRVQAMSTYRYRQLGLDAATWRRSNAALSRALRGGRQLTRSELAAVLQRAGIDTQSQRLPYLIMHAELDGVICSGARRGKQHTYALLEERVPATKPLDREQALAELTRRYFTSHGPATAEDFMWWSGLGRTDVTRGIEMCKHQLACDTFSGKTCWFSTNSAVARNASRTAFLLPYYDEYMVGYTDRSAIFDSSLGHLLDARTISLLQPTVVIDGQIVGTWKRTLIKGAVIVDTQPYTRWGKSEQRAVAAAAQRYGEFLELPVRVAQADTR